MAELRISDTTGHSTHSFDKTNKVSVEEAEKVFKDLIENKKYAAFDTSTEDHKMLRTFDQDAEIITIIGPLAGG